MLLLLTAFSVAPAHAQEFSSEPIDFVLEDSVELYNSSEFSTGWVPSGSPLAVQFQIASEGGAWVGMDGRGDLTWPEALTLQLTGEPETGEIIVDAELAAVTSLRFDVAGYAWEEELDRRGIVVEGEALFDPFLLAGTSPDRAIVEFEGSRTQLIDYSFDVFTGVSLEFAVDMGPEALTTFEGVHWWTEEGAVAQEFATVHVEPLGLGVQTTDTTFVGRWQSTLDLVLNPVFSVCVAVVGCFDLVDLDVPIPLAFEDFEAEFEPTYLDFPLPVLSLPDGEAYDLGEVAVGAAVNQQVAIRNDGELNLEGAAGLLGSPFFTSYPETFLAGPYTEDGVVVTFAPESPGTFSATMVLESNDPLEPLTEISFTGVAVDPDGEDAEEEGGGAGGEAKPVTISSEVGCGCGTTGAPAWPGMLAFAAGGLVMVRRRREE